MTSPIASIEIQAKFGKLAGQLSEVRAQFGTFSDGVSNKLKAMAGAGAKSTAVMLGNLASAGVQKGLGYLEDSARGVLDLQRMIDRLGIATRKTPEQMAEFKKSVRSISDETGLGTDVLATGIRAYVDLAGAGAMSAGTLRTLARVAQASETDISSIATVMYSAGKAMKIDPSEFESAFSGMINMSKDGTVHFKQYADEVIALAPKFARFGVTGRQGLIELSAMFQTMRGNFKDAAETATGMEGMFKGLQLHADKFEAWGIVVKKAGRDGVKHMLPIAEILKNIGKSKILNDPSSLIKAVGRGEGAEGVRSLLENAKAMDEMVRAGQSATTVTEDLQAVLATPSGRIDAAWNRVKLTLADTFTPDRIDAFAHAMESLPSKIGPTIAALEHMGQGLRAIYRIGQGIAGIGSTTFEGIDVIGMSTKAGQARLRDQKIAQDAYSDITGSSGSDALFGASDSDKRRGKAFEYSGATGPGAVAKREAAAQYFKEEGIVPPDQLGQQMVRELQRIQANTAKAMVVVADGFGDAVLKSAANAGAHRRGRKP